MMSKPFVDSFFSPVRKTVLLFAIIAGLAVFGMIVVTVIDVILRIFRMGIPGAYDIVQLCSLIAISCALPYVTAVKGHIAIEFFYHRFSKKGRFLLDSFFRILSMLLFALLSYRTILYGLQLHASGQVMPTINIPVFWMPWLISLSCILVFLTILYHLLNPGKEMIKP